MREGLALKIAESLQGLIEWDQSEEKLHEMEQFIKDNYDDSISAAENVANIVELYSKKNRSARIRYGSKKAGE